MTADELDALRRAAIRDSTTTDELVSELLGQVIALEAVIAARWPRSVLARRRLARDLRASVRHIGGTSFSRRRADTIGTGWLGRSW